jgi:short-subunit dehydrogenase
MLKKITRIIILILFIKICYRITNSIYQYIFMRELNLRERYGKNKWVMITGSSSGIGKNLALGFAERNFNICLIGSKRTKLTISEIKKINKNVQIEWIEADLSNMKSYPKIENWAKKYGKDWAILINNVGHRTGSSKYENYSIKNMKKSINVGTLPQSILTQYMIRYSIKNSDPFTAKGIVNITSLCQTHTDLFNYDPIVSLPYLSVYEATNAYGFYHSESVRKEINDRFNNVDYLTITPGAVITEKTKKIMNPPLSIEASQYSENIIKLLGNKQGISSAYWGHSFISTLVNIFPFIKTPILKSVSKNIAINLSKTK